MSRRAAAPWPVQDVLCDGYCSWPPLIASAGFTSLVSPKMDRVGHGVTGPDVKYDYKGLDDRDPSNQRVVGTLSPVTGDRDRAISATGGDTTHRSAVYCRTPQMGSISRTPNRSQVSVEISKSCCLLGYERRRLASNGPKTPTRCERHQYRRPLHRHSLGEDISLSVWALRTCNWRVARRKFPASSPDNCNS